MRTNKKGFIDLRVIIGLVILAGGVLLLLDSLGVYEGIRIWNYWPVILILIGIKKILDPQPHREVYWGVVLLAVGSLFLLDNLDIIEFRFGALWPILLILVGIEIMKGSWHSKAAHKKSSGSGGDAGQEKDHGKFLFHSMGSGNARKSDIDYVNITAILGGGEYNFTNKTLKGGTITAIMGGCELDLRDADMESEEIVIETFALMGGIEIRVPSNWQVVMNGVPILGAMENKARPENGVTKRLIVKGAAIMGAVEIK